MKLDKALKGFLAAVLIWGPASMVRGQQVDEINVGLASASFATASLRIANELGVLDDANIKAEFVATDGSSVALAGVLSNSFDMAIVGLPELILARARGQDVVAIATTYSGFATSMVLSAAAAERIGVGPDAPFAERLKAVDGLVIGVPSTTAGGTVAFQAAARAQGAEAQLAIMAQPAMQAALETGAVDGYLSSAPFWAFPIVKGAGHLWISGPRGEFPEGSTPTVTAVLLAQKAYVDAHPELVSKLKAVIAEVGKAIEERPDEVKAAVAKLYPDLPADALHLLFEVESTSWNSRQMGPEDLRREIGLVKATGIALPPEADTLDPAAMLVP